MRKRGYRFRASAWSGVSRLRLQLSESLRLASKFRASREVRTDSTLGIVEAAVLGSNDIGEKDFVPGIADDPNVRPVGHRHG
jgi:hypothetical protein